MKGLSLYGCVLLGVMMISCYEDLGNYTYHDVEEAVVYNLEGKTFIANVGDSLIITPEVKHSLMGTDKLVFEWSIGISTEIRSEYFYGPSLRILFVYRPQIYPARLTITDKTNGMKYFYDFKIEGRSDFYKGAMVLSEADGKGVLSFIKPGDILKTNLYESINHESLPSAPLQLELVTYPQPGFDAYWILTAEVDRPGVILNSEDLSRNMYIRNKFFDPPDRLQAEHIMPGSQGTTMGVYNGKLYIGGANTAPYHPTYGAFGNPVDGDYLLAPSFIFHADELTQQFIVGYEKRKKRFEMFYIGPAHSVVSDYAVNPHEAGFNPKSINMDLVHMMYLNDKASYAFFKDGAGDIYEFKFSNRVEVFIAERKRKFKGSNLVTGKTLWQGASNEIIFFTSNDRIYQYNPVTEEIRQLNVNPIGNIVTMIHLDEENNELIAGIEGKLYYLDVSTGQNGRLKKVITGIPGRPIDMVIRK